MTNSQPREKHDSRTGRIRDDNEKNNMEKLIEYLVKANLLQDSRTREYVEAVSRNKALMDASSILQRRSFYLNVLYLIQGGRMVKADCCVPMVM